MSSFRFSFVLLQAGVLFHAAGCLKHSPSSSSSPPAKPIAVRTVSVQQQALEQTTSQPATVHALYRAEVRANVSGYVDVVRANIGDYVEKGDVLAKIDIPEMEKQKQILEARVLRSQSEEQRGLAGIDLA